MNVYEKMHYIAITGVILALLHLKTSSRQVNPCCLLALCLINVYNLEFNKHPLFPEGTIHTSLFHYGALLCVALGHTIHADWLPDTA